jgi:hypothetical protein
MKTKTLNMFCLTRNRVEIRIPLHDKKIESFSSLVFTFSILVQQREEALTSTPDLAAINESNRKLYFDSLI